MYQLADELIKNYTWEAYKKLWDMAYDWNATHSKEEEIYMSELWQEDGYDHDGFSIEDNQWYFED